MSSFVAMTDLTSIFVTVRTSSMATTFDGSLIATMSLPSSKPIGRTTCGA
jgi:hypothetical protein